MEKHDAYVAVGCDLWGSRSIATGYNVIVIGTKRRLYETSFGGTLADKFDRCILPNDWERAIDSVPPTGGKCSLYLDRASMIVLPDEPGSRHGSPTHSHIISDEIRSMNITQKNVNIIILLPPVHIFAAIAAVSRCFPTYSRKKDFSPVNVHVEIILKGGEMLGRVDMAITASVAYCIRNVGRLVDTPANELTTTAFVHEAISMSEALGVQHMIIKGIGLLNAGFGGLYHVGKAAATPPAFLVLTHEPLGLNWKDEECIAFVGEGIVFDSGRKQMNGRTVLPGMKGDMAGAAALLGAFYTLVRNGFKKRLHLCLCIAESSVSPESNKPDDVITLLSGKTVELKDTDADSRLVLADGVFYAKQVLKASVIIDMATLTGAAVNMTGRSHAAFMSNRENMERKVICAGRASGELAFPMIFAPELYKGDLSSRVADLKNSIHDRTMAPPSVVAALFIGANIDYGEGIDWIHVDMYHSSQVEERATSFGVGLIVALLGEFTDSPTMQNIIHTFLHKE